MDKFEARTNHRLRYSQFLSFLLFPFQITCDFFGIEKLGVFQAYCYKKAYLSESTSHRIALLHYLLIGEHRGYAPNAFTTVFYDNGIANRRRRAGPPLMP